jgi:peptidoglycan/xylan/chitin deacetylase (PgdA/CDA1 family)
MFFRGLLASARRGIISALGRREVRLPDMGPLVSFSFDDFPCSALQVGGAILKSYGMSGTYYTAMGLMGTVNELGSQFRAEDLATLLKDDHELGSHTFGHVSCRALPLSKFEAEVIKGKEAVERITGGRQFHHFAYPYGDVTLRAKAKIGARCASCRSILPGINTSPVDLNLLRANHLYSWSFDMDVISRLVTRNDKQRGWLIFYTHDVSDRPSAFGCTLSQFEGVVKLVAQAGATVLPVGKAVERAIGVHLPDRDEMAKAPVHYVGTIAL